MNLFRKKLSVVFALTLASASYAANEIGNGGDWVVFMPNTLSAHYELLDYTEGRMLRGLQYDLDAAVGGLDRYLSDVQFRDALVVEFISRIRKFSSSKADMYKTWIDNFYSEARFVNAELTDISDSGHLLLPHGKQIIQGVIQQVPVFPEDKRYIISQPHWKYAITSAFDPGLGQVNEVGMILHEVIYRDALSRGHLNSAKVRYFHSVVASSAFESFDSQKWQELLRVTDLD